MTSSTAVYIAGVGLSPSPSQASSAKQVVTALVSAATKALLDAGVTFDDVSQGIAGLGGGSVSATAAQAFEAFDPAGITVDNVEYGLEFENAFRQIGDRGAQSVLTISLERSTAVALLLVSDSFLWRHPYLKDSAALIRKLDTPQNDTKGESSISADEICRRVWTLRGWSGADEAPGLRDFVWRTTRSTNSFKISRVDGKAPPSWSEVEHKQDGKHRLGYNPAKETRDVSHEDFETVRTESLGRDPIDNNARFKRKGGDRASLAKL